MVAKLKLITNQIHWSLLVKSLIVAFGWIFLPFWLFLLISLFFYFYPPFQSLLFFLPFLVFLFLAKILTVNIFSFLLLIVLFYLILGIKDLIIINRFLAYQIFIYLLIFTCAFLFFLNFNSGLNLQIIFYGFLLALLYFLFFKNINLFGIENNYDFKKYKISLALFSLFLFELILILNFLPFSFYFKTLIFAMVIILGYEIILNYVLAQINKNFLIGISLIFIILFIFTLLFNNWSLS